MEYRKVLEARQSVRKYKNADVPKEDILKMLDAARLAPSGKNMQNWHFVTIKNKELIAKIAKVIEDKNEEIVQKMGEIDEKKALRFQKFCQVFTLFFKDAPVLVVAYATNYYPSGYFELSMIEEDKFAARLLDEPNPGMQSIGAAIENLILEAVNLGYGSCWLTSANYAAKEITELLKTEIGFEKENYFMAAMISIGVPAEGTHKSPSRKELDQIYTYVE